MATKTILIVAANPSDTGQLRLAAEVRDITEGLALSSRHHTFKIVNKWAVRPKDLQRAVLQHSPEFVHFSGHGVGEAGILLENDAGEAQQVSGEALSLLFSLCPSVKCVLLNACYSEVQAEAIAEHVDYVVGMSNTIGDRAALKFAVGFYDALGFNRTVPDAYRFGRVSIEMEGIAESDVPILKIRPDLTDTETVAAEEATEEAQPPTDELPPLEEPEGMVRLGSPFYVERQSIEADCRATVVKPGSLLRIKAARAMGKSSLMARTLDYAERRDCQVVRFNFRAADSAILEDLDLLLQWFCYSVTDALDLPDNLDDAWDSNRRLGLLQRCQRYFEKSILAKLSGVLVLGLDEVDQICKYPDVAIDFFSMLRVWHEAAKYTPKWRNVHMVIAHTQDIDIPLEAKRSPFNVGTAIKLQEFGDAELNTLIEHHGLALSKENIRTLKTLLGGHPYLWREAMYRLAQGRMTLAQLQNVAATDKGPFGLHLQQCLADLNSMPELAETFWDILQTEGIFSINSSELSKRTTQLDSMGLVKYQGAGVVPLCDLYCQYFRARLT